MFEVPFMRLALGASAAASVALGVVGVYLIIRRVVFLGLVLANAATVGAAVGQIFGWPPEIVGIVTTVAAGLALGAIPAPRRISAESIMGWAYATAAATTVLILAGAARADADTLHFLYGNVLAVRPSHAAGLALLALAVLAVHGLFAQRFLLVTFDAEGAHVGGVNARGWSLLLNLWIGVTTAAAVHELGVLLTFSLLTLAPTTSLLVTRSLRSTFFVSAAIGVMAVFLGLVGSWYLDLPPGPSSVVPLSVAVVVAGVLGNRFSRRAKPASPK
ncbi:MAG TPA: metal ABC transporter permease [Thermoanaerobaculia bacterium]|nr:metal ABC transporter permease [Thermoanaerobaculia bacterium]